ncbi:MAG: hypothetical protein IJ415_04125 [Clostridia bacterium]|nr:hypothetical protein [Clostridia bacterium]
MKKFLIFLVSLVVVVCVGLTTYYFMRNNEIITIKTKEIYCNAGDTIPLKSLGISIENANISKKTKFDYNAGGEDVTKYIKYDEQLDSFVVSQENAGEVTLVISTTNKKYSDFTVNVHIGNGSTQNPYFIFNETDLSKIGSIYRLDKSYILMTDIALTSNFQPIGYNDVTASWSGFNGTFDGQNHVISGLKIVDKEIDNAGLFSSINTSANVKNLTLEKATISGQYKNAGVLAGEISGNIEKVVVKDASILNTASNSNTGAIAGCQNINQIMMSYAEGVEINIGTDETAVSGAIVGGLVGKVSEASIQVSYVNNVEIKPINATLLSGGFVGEFVIGTETGSIQQSYANTTCGDASFGAFVGKISTTTDFNKENANMLRFFIGNMAVVYGRTSQASILDTDVVKSYDNTFFKNMTYADRAVFYEKDSAMYLIRGFAGAGDMIETNEYIYYGIDANNLISWDTTYVWNVENNSLPTLKMNSIYPEGPSSEYLRRDLLQKDLNNKTAFLNLFKSDIKDESIKFLDDMDLTDGWTPISVTNTTIDGNNKTVTINIDKAINGNAGLFTIVENSTIKNLNIVVTGVSANATNLGALAGIIKSTDGLTSSTIENVTITYQAFSTPVITNFGGIAGKVEKTTISNCSVSGLSINPNSSIGNVGGLVAINNGTINNCIASVTVYGTTNVGGVVAINNGSIVGVSGPVSVKYNKATSVATIGGIVATNNGVIRDFDITIHNIDITNAGLTTYVGGVAGDNSGEITNVSIGGNDISIADLSGTIYVGGVAGSNSGTITNVNNNMDNVGTYHINRNQYVGGITAINNGKISKVLIQANLNGNYVSGVVAIMNKSKASVDQVVVGKYNSSSKVLSANSMKGDKYLAGVIVEFKAGKITNVQCASDIYGETNSTRSSLVALIFPYGATLKNATINSSLNGYGTFYRETWTDFASFTNKSEFGLTNGETGDERYNIYKYDTYHGIMQSVVINSAKAGVSSAKAAMGSAFAWGKDYQDTADSSFVKVVDGFSDVNQFQGSFTFVCATSTLFKIKHKATKTLTFDIGTYWESNNGISLIFLNNLFQA